MKAKLIIGALTIIALSFESLLLLGAPPQSTPSGPTVATPFVVPSNLIVNTSTVVIFTLPIVDPLLISNSVDLVQISAAGSKAIGQLHDDGADGDLAAGDGIYTLRISLTPPTSGPFPFQITYADKGVLKRITISVVLYVTPSTQPVPPDPGEPGKATLNGVDADHDGVRDDVQRYIASTYASSPNVRTAMTQLAKAELSLIADSSISSLSKIHNMELFYGVECLSSTGVDLNAMSLAVEKQVANTAVRYKAYLQAQSQVSTVKYTLSANPRTRCLQ